ncbi:MAG: EAL domain-containing protein [Aquitalea sp.]|nr:EAL domain-containing protein [Aquitalea sp.]
MLNRPLRLLLASGTVLCGFATQLLVWEKLGPVPPWLLLYPSVFTAAILTGAEGGLLATALAAVLGWYYFIPPRFSFAIDSAPTGYSIVVFSVMGVAFSLFSQKLRAAREANARAVADAKLRMVLDHAADAVIVASSNGLLAYGNMMSSTLLQYSAEELSTLSVMDITAPEDAEKARLAFQQLLDFGHARSELMLLAKDGRRIATEINAIKAPDGSLIGTARDISEYLQIYQALVESQTRLQLLIDHAPASLALFDRDMHYLAVSQRWCDDYSLGERDLLGHSHYEIFPEIPEHWKSIHQQALAGETIQANEDVFLRADGKLQWLRWEVRPWRTQDGGVGGIVIFSEDITAHKEASRQAQDSKERLELALAATQEGVWDYDIPSGRVTHNRQWCRIFGLDEEQLEHPVELFFTLIHPDDLPEVSQRLEAAMKHGSPFDGEFRMRHSNGHYLWVEDRGQVVARSPEGKPLRMVGAVSDITKRRADHERIRNLAYFDQISNLPNRTLLMDRLGLALSIARRQGHMGALVLLNLDRFQTVNDAHGREVGDSLLRDIGERLSRQLREGDTLARIAGDEFAILLQDCGQDWAEAGSHAIVVAEKVHAAMGNSFLIATGDQINLSVSIGIARCPRSAEDSPQEVLRRADTALHKAKQQGGGQTTFFDADMDQAVKERFAVDRDLRSAIRDEEFRLFLQPQVDFQGRLLGAEALVRWQHPSRGLLPPAAFIGLAEESAQIISIDNWMLSQVCQLLVAQTMAGHPLHLSVNLSPRQFRQPGFICWFKSLLESTGADPTQLTLEVTESLFIDNINEVVAKMNELAALGIRFSIDDFGTGYSSLAYLKRMPIHELKIDKSFVQGLPTDLNDVALVETMLAMARHMHLRVVAEGVETPAQAAFFSGHGAVVLQGYLYGKPEPAQQWIKHWHADTALLHTSG